MAGQTARPDTAFPPQLGSGQVPEPPAPTLPIHDAKRPTLFDPPAKRPTVFDVPAGRSPSDPTPFPAPGALDGVRDALTQDPASGAFDPRALQQPNVCPGCGGELRTAVGRGWCIKCGYTSDLQSKPAIPKPSPRLVVPLWAGALLAGCGLVVAATAYRGRFVPEDSAVGVWWILIEGAAGLAGYLLASLWAVALTFRHWRESDIFKLLDPTSVWNYAVEHLPRTRWAICLGGWGATASVCAVVLLWQNNFALKSRALKTKDALQARASNVRVADEAAPADVASAAEELPAGRAEEEARKPPTIDLFAADRPVKEPPAHLTDCVVIGYVMDPADPGRIDQLVLGTRGSDGTIRYAGTVNQFAKTDEVGRWAERVKGLKPLLDAPAYLPGTLHAVPVEPTLSCQISYAERTTQGVLKGTVVKGVGDAKPAGDPGAN
jgi:hypothetical protein